MEEQLRIIIENQHATSTLIFGLFVLTLICIGVVAIITTKD